MRLISCHIENFGRLHDYDMTFSEGLNVLCRENGWGKSTLAAFIKAMLYGPSGERKRGIDENERKRYKPWQGGIFGGQLCFEAGGKEYSVTRTFGDSASKDTFELRDSRTNLVSRDYSDRLGEELFKLNSASFCRSIFIGQSECQTASTDDIHAKIGNLADNTDDMNSFEAAESRLTKQINRLNPNRSTGSLYALADEIAALRRKVAEGNGLSSQIAECENEIARTETERRSVVEVKTQAEHKQKLAIRQQQLRMQRGEWDRLKKAVADTQSALASARAKFPGDLPSEDSVRDALHSVVEIKSAQCLMSSYKLSADEENLFQILKARFETNAPSPEEIDAHLSEEQELRRIHEKYERIRLTNDERIRFDSLLADFSEEEISPSELAAAWNERCGKKAALSSKRAALSAVRTSFHDSLAAAKRRSTGLIVSGCALIILGIALFFWFSDLWYLSASVTGGLFLATGILYAVILHMQQPPDQLMQLQNEIELDEEFIDSSESTTEQYLSSHGITFNEQYVTAALQELCGDRRDLDALAQKAEIAENYLRSTNLIFLDKSVRDFLLGCGVIPDDSKLSDQLFELKENVAEYESLAGKKEKYDDAQRNYLSLTQQVSEFLRSVGLNDTADLQEALERIRDDLAEYTRLNRQLSSTKNELAAFESVSDLSALENINSDSDDSLEAIADMIRECSGQTEKLSGSVNSLRQKRSELYQKLEQWERDNCDLHAKTERQAADSLKYERLVKTKELLRRAKESMTARYIEPVSSGFRKYHELIEGLSPDRYRIDADIRVTVNELGQQREIDSLSAGYRDLTGICLRLALADAMYRDEKPMLIMDDPFNNLDDCKVAASKELLQAVSEHYQIIYFTCSSARAAKMASGQWKIKQN